MPLDIFSRGGADFGGSFAADASKIFFSAEAGQQGAVGLLTQSINLGYQQQITRVYEIGSQKTFYIIGRASGNGQLAQILGPRPLQLGFYKKFGNACNAATNNLTFMASTGCDQVGNVADSFNGDVYAFDVRGIVINNIGISTQAQDSVINQSLSLMFLSLNSQQGA